MREMRAQVMAAILFVPCALWAQEGAKVMPGEPPPREIRERLRPLHDELRKALELIDEEASREVSERIVEAMGPWAGNPEAVPRYFTPIERGEPAPEAVWRLWGEIERRVRRDVIWVAVPEGDPEKMTNGPRTAGRPVIAYSILACLETDQQRRKETPRLVRAGADYLLKLQRENGLFAFPDLRGDHPLFGPMVERLLSRKPQALVEGWIVDDLNGDLQYDNGICGVAMVEAFEVTKDESYLESARRACDWVIGRPLSINWNYNAFSVWLLARYARASGDKSYLDAALEKLKVGVLPGQMKNGRWFDGHNARLVYHGIIMRGMLEVYRTLEKDHPFRTPLGADLTGALDHAAAQIREKGASSNATTTEVLSEALIVLGPNKQWEEALRININAGLHVMDDRSAPNVGLYLPHYLRYLEARSGAPEH